MTRNYFAGNKFRLISLLMLTLGLLTACSRQQPKPQGKPVFPVTVASVESKTMPVEVTAIGNVEAFSTVSIKTQVTGQLVGVHFKEGDYVKKGQLLFTLDKRPFEAALAQAQGQLARDTASLANAKSQASRYEALFKQGIISKEQYDSQQTQADAMSAAVEADRAAVQAQKVQLAYTDIYSPIDGRTGDLIAHEGNMIKANDSTALVVINKVQPVYVTFSVPENRLADIKHYDAKNQLVVRADIAGDPSPAFGKLAFIDNGVDTATGTIKLKGEFANADRRLWPGSFADVTLKLTTQPDAVVIPSAAIQNGQQGQYVFVVKDDKTVEMRSIKVDRGNDKESVIAAGLQPGETVVTDGQVRLTPGSSVKFGNNREASAPQAAQKQGNGS